MATTLTQNKVRRRSTSRLFSYFLTYALLTIGSILILIPFWWLVRSSLMDPGDIFKPIKSLGDFFRCSGLWQNYPDALKFMNFLGCLRNTITITFFAMSGQIMSASIVAYGFARMRFPGRDVLFIVLLATIMLPPQVTLIPIFKIFTTLGWYDTFYPLTVPAFFGGGVFAIFLLRQYYMTIPIEMDEAAKIDGAGTFGIFTKVILPQAKPALGTVAIFSFMAHWNDFLGPLIYLSDPAKRTLALALWSFQGEHAVEWHLLMAAATVVMLPLLVIFFCAQKYFIQGVVISGVKG
ncbi:MAG: carbohydrate ABC transporter permease [Armatimonadetes bacterium]|nr:carbohydrate ABC transporter permease [Armatimonadota bacterium]